MMGDGSVARRQGFASEGEQVTREMAETAARAAAEMFGKDVTIIDLRELVSYADYFVVTSAETDRQTRRVAEEVIDKMIEAGHRPRSKRVDEGSASIFSTSSSTSLRTRLGTTIASNPSGAAPPRSTGRSSRAKLTPSDRVHIL
jgi:hypothetical protein